jgi:hypothetical protein
MPWRGVAWRGAARRGAARRDMAWWRHHLLDGHDLERVAADHVGVPLERDLGEEERMSCC